MNCSAVEGNDLVARLDAAIAIGRMHILDDRAVVVERERQECAFIQMRLTMNEVARKSTLRDQCPQKQYSQKDVLFGD